MSKELNAAEGRLGRVVVVRLAPGTDLLKGIPLFELHPVNEVNTKGQ